MLVLGPTPNPSDKTNKDSLPDYLIKEQYYLDNYKLEFNIQRRVVHTNYVPSSGVSVNVGQSNPSYNLLGKDSFAPCLAPQRGAKVEIKFIQVR